MSRTSSGVSCVGADRTRTPSHAFCRRHLGSDRFASRPRSHGVGVNPGSFWGRPLVMYVRCAYARNVPELRFEWAPAKAEANARKHGVTFNDAQSVFADDRARLIDDPDHSNDEIRFVLLGLSYSLRLVVVVHCYRSEGNIIRIISARKAVPHEARFYP